MKAAIAFAVTTAVLLGLTGWLGVIWFHSRIGDEGVRAIIVSGGVALTVQLLTFGIASHLATTNLLAGWGAGMLVRLLTLIFHGFFGVPLLGLPMGAALVSLAAFFFLSTLIEPFFLGPTGTSAVPSGKHQ